MTTLPRDVALWIEANIPASRREEALDLLERAVDHAGEKPGPRLLRCAAVASRGDFRKLAYYVDLLRIDFRDVIMAGEYDVVDGVLVHVRRLDEPMPPTAGMGKASQSAQ